MGASLLSRENKKYKGIAIVAMLLQGYTIKEIAHVQGHTPTVICRHLDNIRLLYKCKTTYQLVGVLLARGELRLPDASASESTTCDLTSSD